MFINRKVKYDYHILKEYVAGISLIGSEVSSLKNGKCSFNGSYCIFKGNELFMRNVNLAVADKTMFPHDPYRDKKLLLTKKELLDLNKSLNEEKGRTIVVYKIYRPKNGTYKALICLVKGKKDYDKRESIKIREIQRTINSLKK